MSPNCNNANCSGFEADEGACLDMNSDFIPPILDCEDHFRLCQGDCHSECSCQNP